MEKVRPERGGFRRAFGCGWFIREYLLGHGPVGSQQIDPVRGAPQTDIFSDYKDAIRRTYAEDAVAREEEKRIKRGQPAYTPEERERRENWYLMGIPRNLHRARYHSFVRYFHWLKQLEWVEPTGEEEKAAIQDEYEQAPPRRFYRLTQKGIDTPDEEWAHPQLFAWPELAERLGEYAEERRRRREKRRALRLA